MLSLLEKVLRRYLKVDICIVCIIFLNHSLPHPIPGHAPQAGRAAEPILSPAVQPGHHAGRRGAARARGDYETLQGMPVTVFVLFVLCVMFVLSALYPISPVRQWRIGNVMKVAKRVCANFKTCPSTPLQRSNTATTCTKRKILTDPSRSTATPWATSPPPASSREF